MVYSNLPKYPMLLTMYMHGKMVPQHLPKLICKSWSCYDTIHVLKTFCKIRFCFTSISTLRHLSIKLLTDFQLEDGEIDVRLNSFKGCLSQDKSNKHNEKLPGESNPDLGIGWDYIKLFPWKSSPCVGDYIVKWIIVFTF